jgi:hypothetical protein
MLTKWKYALSATLVALSLWLWLKPSDITDETLRMIEADIEAAVRPILELYTKSQNAYLFIYYSNYERRIYFVKPDGLVNPDEAIDDDEFFSEALLYHRANLCMTKETIDLPPSSLRDALIINDALVEGAWYISCPIFIQDRLIGYVSVVEPIDDRKLAPTIHNVQLIAHQIKQVFLDNL